MSEASFTLSAFGDEIAADLEAQLRTLRDLGIEYLELRGAWGKNVLRFDDDDVEHVRRTCDDHGVSVGSIGSPIGKSLLTDPLDTELANLLRAFEIGEQVGTRNVRIFSFYPPDTTTNAHYDAHVEESASRLARLSEAAEREGFTLLLENERAIVGDVPRRCHALLAGVDCPNLRFLWDPANFVLVHVERPTDCGWELLGEYVGYVHVKDAVAADGSICPAGEGDGQVGQLLDRLTDSGYRGILALEPHLVTAGHSTGFSGPEGMAVAAAALRRLLAGASHS